MHVSSLELRNFKRFTDLTIDLSKLAQPPKLVLLIGANGSGKSSVFDGFELLANLVKNKGLKLLAPESYYHKTDSLDSKTLESVSNFEVKITTDLGEYVYGENIENLKSDAFYGRSSLRQVPRLTRTTSQEFDIASDTDRPRFYIDRDNRFENDIEILAQQILDEVFNGDDFDAQQLKEEYLQPINRSLNRIFGSLEAPLLELISLKPPLRGNVADIQFKKGTARFHYDLLSSGEKEVINILLNLFVRRDTYQDTIYFIDELDLHLNTRLQYNLLKEITENWIPDHCQLWIASHSYGFIDYAREVDHAAIIDFDSFDFDVKQVLLPEPKDSLDVFDVAIPKESIFKLFYNKQIVLCENQNDEFYNLLGLKDILFVGVRDKNQVFLSAKADPRYQGVMDRDFLTNNEIERVQKKYPTLRVLSYYCFENYLYHPDNIAELVNDFDKQSYVAEIDRQKKAQQMKIVAEVKTVRNSYAILKEDDIRDKSIETIVEEFSSDEFEAYYPYFDMKSKFNKVAIASYNLTREQLVTTPWFKQKIAEALA